jgi:hypothetical protein
MTAWRAPSSPQAVVQTLFRNVLFVFFYLSLFTTLVYYLSSITPDLLPLGYYPDAGSFPRLNLPCKPLVPLPGKSHAVPATERRFTTFLTLNWRRGATTTAGCEAAAAA